jgi:membrane protease YdiL (CAAX protease family)
MKRIALRYPLAFVLVVGLLFAGCHYVWELLLADAPEATRSALAKATSFVFAVVLLTGLGWWRSAGFSQGVGWRTVVPALPLAVLPLLIGVLGQWRVADPVQLALLLLIAAITGFAEEAVFRGVVACALLPLGLVRATLLSSLLFGGLHLANLLAGADPVATGLQVIVAVLYGFTATAILLYSGSIWPLIGIHGIQDFLAFVTTGSIANTATPSAGEVAVVIAIMVPIAAYGVWLLRRCVGRMSGDRPTGEAPSA